MSRFQHETSKKIKWKERGQQICYNEDGSTYVGIVGATGIFISYMHIIILDFDITEQNELSIRKVQLILICIVHQLAILQSIISIS